MKAAWAPPGTTLRSVTDIPRGPDRAAGARTGLALLILALALYYRALLLVTEDWSEIDLPDVWLFVVIVAAIGLTHWRKLIELPGVFLRKGVVEWLPFFGWAVASLLWTHNGEYGATKLASFAALGLFPAAVIVFLGGAQRDRMWLAVLAGGLLFDVVGLALGQASDARLSFRGNNPIWIARSCYMTVSIAMWAGGVHWLPRVLALAPSVYLALGTGSRGPLVGVLAAPVIASLVRSLSARGERKTRRKWKTWIALAAVVGGVAIALGAGALTGPSGGVGVERVLTLFESGSSLSEDAAVAERMYLQRAAWDRFVESPIVGAGAGGSAPAGDVAYPHNILLEVACEFGLIGLALWLWSVLQILRRARDHGVLLVLFAQAVIYSMSSGDLSGNELIVVLGGMVGAAAARESSIAKGTRPVERERLLGYPAR